MGAFSQGITVTTVYATLGMDAVVEAVIDNLVPVIVCNKKDVARLLFKISSMPTLKTIVYVSDLVAPNDADAIQMPSPPRGVTVISFEDFCASGDVKAFPPTPPKKESTAVVMYTSGSTGKPKGVIIKHSQILACVAAAELVLPLRDGEDVYLAYLPLAHIMEMVAEFVLVSLGCTLCFSEPRSLTDAGSYPKGALEVFSPTLMV
jgi:long-chain acyl-CoA synthetase